MITKYLPSSKVSFIILPIYLAIFYGSKCWALKEQQEKKGRTNINVNVKCMFGFASIEKKSR